MPTEGWPPIACERFDGESEESYRQRAARIAEIVTGFRWGRIAPEVADELEEELVALREPGSEIGPPIGAPRLRAVSRAPSSNRSTLSKTRHAELVDEARH